MNEYELALLDKDDSPVALARFQSLIDRQKICLKHGMNTKVLSTFSSYHIDTDCKNQGSRKKAKRSCCYWFGP
jgi:hypothetical protein